MRFRDLIKLPSFKILVPSKRKARGSTTCKGAWPGYGLVRGKWIPPGKRND